MNSYLIDSDILMDFFKKKKDAVNIVSKLAHKGELAASIMSIVELRSGWNEEDAEYYLPQFYKLVSVKAITKKIAELAGAFRQQYKEKGIALALVDTIIAATVIEERLQLVTNNRKDFPMPEIKLYPMKKVGAN